MKLTVYLYYICIHIYIYIYIYICRAGHDTQKIYNGYNYNYTLFSYN